jgi:PPK2 family polyphosphate:nucleotide phosphotransferase
MLEPVPSRWLVPFEKRFDVTKAPTRPPSHAPRKHALQDDLDRTLRKLSDEQRKLVADDRRSLLVVVQGLDAAGKDGTIRAITSGLDAAGCRVTSFKAPSAEELDHDFLWRVHHAAPERGTIGIFNRSHYEEVLVVRVQPSILAAQRLPDLPRRGPWDERFDSIRDLERHLARNGTSVIKFWLHVSREEQRKRFLDRIEEKQSRWKFSADDVDKARSRPAYLEACSAMLSETSRPWAPWYCVPADDKHYLRATVADVMLRSLKAMKLRWPEPAAAQLASMKQLEKELERDE